MILAAGVGSRLGALTANTPKCLMEINGIPMLRLVSQNLASAGVSEVVINIHHHSEQVRSYALKSLKDLFKNIEFSFEPELLGTGGGLKEVAHFFSGEDVFLLVNADIYTSLPLQNLLKPLFSSKQTLGCLAVMDRTDKTYLEFDPSGHFCGWLRSENQSKTKNAIKAFCGLQALSTRIFNYLNLESQKSFSIIETYLKAFDAGERLISHDLGNNAWFDMGTPEQLNKLREYLVC